jgi:hypothetical protein
MSPACARRPRPIGLRTVRRTRKPLKASSLLNTRRQRRFARHDRPSESSPQSECAGSTPPHGTSCSGRTVTARNGADVRCRRALHDQADPAGLADSGREARGGAKGRQRREQTCRNHSRVRGLKKYNPANFCAINPEDFRVPARTVYSSGRKYEIRAPVNWLSKRRSALAKVNARISLRASRRFETAAQMAGFAARKPGPGNMRNGPKTSLSNGGLADSRGAAGRSPNSGFLNHCSVSGRPFGGSRASGKSNGWRER